MRSPAVLLCLLATHGAANAEHLTAQNVRDLVSRTHSDSLTTTTHSLTPKISS